MHLHFERTCSSRTDCAVLSLTWMGKVPDELPEEDGWRLNRVNYYQDGWLASGNARGIVGVTFTTCHCRKTAEHPVRTNYNLRGHRSEVTLVKWNEPYQKLASCDSSGVIFVWIKHEGRWSIELINDRNTQVTDFAWSHDGRMALICYQDGFVLVGSVAGQRYWSSTLNLDRAAILCGIWAPDDHQVLFGTSSGQILVSDMHGEVVAQVTLVEDTAIVAMAWSCEKFKMEEADDDQQQQQTDAVPPSQAPESKLSVLAVCFSSGVIHVMKNYDDISPTIINTGLKDVKVEWSNNGEMLAVAGVTSESAEKDCRNKIHFYTDAGLLRFVATIPYTQSPVTAMTWGHNDKRLFVATGSVIHIGWVTRRIASLQLLSRLTLHRALRDESAVHKLPLPRRLRALVANLFGQTVKCYLPEANQLREFVSRPHTVRLHCTMVRHDTEDLVTGSATYTLFLEYLGGLVPLLKGKRASKLRPEFVIYDPQQPLPKRLLGLQLSCDVPTSDNSDVDEGCASSPGRRRRLRTDVPSPRAYVPAVTATAGGVTATQVTGRKELFYTDELPEREKIVAVTSNLWGTKFKVVGLACWLPPILGMVTYRTSLLHLQPRQMTLLIKELQGPQPGRSPALVLHNGGSSGAGQGFSEDDDDDMCDPVTSEESAPIAPMTPKKRCGLGRQDSAGPETGRAEAGPSEEYLTLETTSEAGVQVLSLRQLGQAAQGTIMSVATQTITGQSTDAKELLPGTSTACPIDDDDPAASPSKRLKADVRTGVRRVSRTLLSTEMSPDGEPPLWGESATPHGGATATASESRVRHLMDPVPRWAEKAGELKYIDEEPDEGVVGDVASVLLLGHHRNRSSIGPPNADFLRGDPRSRGCDARRLTLRSGAPPRACSDELQGTSANSRTTEEPTCVCETAQASSSSSPAAVRKQRFAEENPFVCTYYPSSLTAAVAAPMVPSEEEQSGCRTPVSRESTPSQSPSRLSVRMAEHRASMPYSAAEETSSDRSAPPSPTLSRSIPSSPVSGRKSRQLQLRALLYSPLLLRRASGRQRAQQRTVDSSDEEGGQSGEELLSDGFRDLESMQKAYIRKKLKKRHGKVHQQEMLPPSKPPPMYREFILHNKAPLWNEVSQVYQLDFGGRVTQESAKNFQIEFKGNQVMQFGRIDGNAYTLDFQYPFSALQAFAVALANVTQRLK